MKKIFFFSLLTCLVACSQLSKSLVKDPEVKVADVKVQEIGLSSVKLAVKLDVLNPNPVAIRLDQIDYALKIAGAEVTKGSLDQGVSLEAKQNNVVIVPLQFTYNSAGQALRALMGASQDKTYEVAGNAKFGLFTIPFNKKGEINLSH